MMGWQSFSTIHFEMVKRAKMSDSLKVWLSNTFNVHREVIASVTLSNTMKNKCNAQPISQNIHVILIDEENWKIKQSSIVNHIS